MKLPTLVSNFANRTNYSFINTNLLEEALTHPSVVRAREHVGQIKNSERLEFLGDSVLDLVISDMLFKTFPDEKEGKLSRRKKHLVSGKALAKVAKDLRLCEFIIKDSKNSGKCTPTTLENAIEALIGAVYMDSGFDRAKEFISQYWGTMLYEEEDCYDPKTALQEWSTKHKQPYPSYRTVSESGPKHKPQFTVRANVYYLGSATATASTKKEAQIKAAEMLLKKLNDLDEKKSESENENEAPKEDSRSEAPKDDSRSEALKENISSSMIK